MEYYSAVKKWNSTIYSNMHGPRESRIEWSKSDREGEIAYDSLYMWNLKRNDTNKLMDKTERDIENKRGCRGKR